MITNIKLEVLRPVVWPLQKYGAKVPGRAKTLNAEGSSVVMAEIDVTKEEELGRSTISGSHPLKLFQWRPEDYHGGRSNDFVEFCKNVNVPPYSF